MVNVVFVRTYKLQIKRLSAVHTLAHLLIVQKQLFTLQTVVRKVAHIVKFFYEQSALLVFNLLEFFNKCVFP